MYQGPHFRRQNRGHVALDWAGSVRQPQVIMKNYNSFHDIFLLLLENFDRVYSKFASATEEFQIHFPLYAELWTNDSWMFLLSRHLLAPCRGRVSWYFLSEEMLRPRQKRAASRYHFQEIFSTEADLVSCFLSCFQFLKRLASPVALFSIATNVDNSEDIVCVHNSEQYYGKCRFVVKVHAAWISWRLKIKSADWARSGSLGLLRIV